MYRVLSPSNSLTPRLTAPLMRLAQSHLARALVEAVALVSFFAGFMFWLDVLANR